MVETVNKHFYLVEQPEIHNHTSPVEFVGGDENFLNVGMAVYVLPAKYRRTVTHDVGGFEFI